LFLTNNTKTIFNLTLYCRGAYLIRLFSPNNITDFKNNYPLICLNSIKPYGNIGGLTLANCNKDTGGLDLVSNK